MLKGKIKRIVIKLLVVVLFFSFSVKFYMQSQNMEGNGWKSKIDAEVLTMMSENPKQKIPVYIFFEDYKETEVKKKLEKKGFQEELYEDTELFEEILVPEITNEVIQEVGVEIVYENDVSPDVIKAVEEKEVSKNLCDWESLAEAPELVKDAVSEQITEYKKERAKCVKELCTKHNQEFIETCNIKDEDILFNGELIRSMIVEATAEELKMYAKQSEVESISLYEEIKLEPQTNVVLPQIGADSISGTKTEYTGNNVKIGIIECIGRYDKNNFHFKGKDNLNYLEIASMPEVGAFYHATLVTAIICGEKKTINNKTYEGVVPDAHVYQITISNMQDIYTAIEHFALMGVDVINLSVSTLEEGSTGKYSAADKMFDKLISMHDLIIVNSAGNYGTGNGNVGSPGLALNIITVGNLYTKVAEANTGLACPYSVHASSSYKEASYLPNKPDIVAPGEFSIASYYFNGTSFSAPLVTGVIAQMLEANPQLKANPTLVKSKLLLAADESKVNTTDNASVGRYQREKSGAGMLDAKASIEAAKSSNYNVVTVLNQFINIDTRYYEKGQKVRVVMVAENTDDKYITSEEDLDDVDLYFKASTGSSVSNSLSCVNNVEIIECTIETAGNYTIGVRPVNVCNKNARPKVCVSWEIS